MIISRSSQTARQIQQARSLKAVKRRGRMPRQIAPKRLETEYARKLSAFVVPRVHAAFDLFVQEIGSILSSAHAGMRLDSVLTMDIGEGKRIRELIAQARERMQKTVMTTSLEDLAKSYANQTAVYQKQQLARQTRAALGIDPFIADKRLLPLTQAFVDANVGLVKGLTDDVASRMEKSALTAIQDGQLYNEFSERMQSTFGLSESRATLIARDQTGKLYGQLNATRQRELGVKSFVWRTSEDERVRDEHEALDGQTFDFDDPPEEGLPGEPIQCRCTAEPDFSDILGEADAQTATEAPDDLQTEVPDTSDTREARAQPLDLMHRETPNFAPAEPIVDVEHKMDISKALAGISPFSDINIPAGYTRHEYNGAQYVKNPITQKSYSVKEVEAKQVHLSDFDDKQLKKITAVIKRAQQR